MIQNNARVTLVSGQSIVLGTGFEVKPGAIFTAVVQKDSNDRSAVAAEDLQAKGVVVFPNPARDIVHVISARPILKINVTDVNGRIVQTSYPSAAAASTIDISLSGEPAGVYAVYIFYPDSFLSRKVVLAR